MVRLVLPTRRTTPIPPTTQKKQQKIREVSYSLLRPLASFERIRHTNDSISITHHQRTAQHMRSIGSSNIPTSTTAAGAFSSHSCCKRTPCGGRPYYSNGIVGDVSTGRQLLLSSLSSKIRRRNPLQRYPSFLSLLCCYCSLTASRCLVSHSPFRTPLAAFAFPPSSSTTGGTGDRRTTNTPSSYSNSLNHRIQTQHRQQQQHQQQGNYRPISNACSGYQYSRSTACFSTTSSSSSGSSTQLNTRMSEMDSSASDRSILTWDDEQRDRALRECILPLSEDSHKGSSGRIAILGGSAQYTGAPFYAAMSTLQTGTDLAYILTAEEATLPIKCYSPELMVTSIYKASQFDEMEARNETNGPNADTLVNDMVQKAIPFLERLHCLIIGPGLGRCPLVMKAVAEIIQHAKQRNLHMVLDADALYMVSLPEYRNLLMGYENVVLTPNVVEYKRLFSNGNINDDSKANTNPFYAATIIQKGKHDKIYHNGKLVYTCTEPGGLKRSGGIGDVLSGTVGALVAWQAILSSSDTGSGSSSSLAFSCWTACCFVKRATLQAFQTKQRSMTAPDVLNQLGTTINEMISTSSSSSKL